MHVFLGTSSSCISSTCEYEADDSI
jgi:hypothetical protein